MLQREFHNTWTFINGEWQWKLLLPPSLVIAHWYGCWKLISRVNKLHERALRIVYQDYASSFIELLEKDNWTTIHNRNILLPATELFKVKNGLSPHFMNEIFVENAEHYYDFKKLNLREITLKRCTTEPKL